MSRITLRSIRATLLHTSMESAAELSVPLIVEVGKGSNWDEAH